jgi:NAD(P)-dependent dehydrogenase (short-subunit alcohol dehydrogenase family)
MERLQDRSVIITGAAQGIGAVYAKALAVAGARVSLCDLNDPGSVVDEIRAGGGKAIGGVADVTSPEAMARLVEETVAAFGGVTVLINNAALFGTLKPRPFMEIESAEWDRVMAVNTRGVFECTKAVVPVMRAAKYGKIINIASGTLFKGSTGLLHYVASKGAVVAMTRVLARELGSDNIMVNAIAPGLTMTEAVQSTHERGRVDATVNSRAIKREQVPEDIVGAVLFFASAESDFVTGQTLLVDGGSFMH